MHCAQGHELVGTESCPTCGDPLPRCSNGHTLSGSEKFCPECGEVLEKREEVTSIDPTTFEQSPVIPFRGTFPSPESGNVVVVCGKCGFEEIASAQESGWQCGQCDVNWYVITCGFCYETQLVPEEVWSCHGFLDTN